MKKKNLALILISFFIFFSAPVFARMNARPKACAMNIRVLLSAIEMYNMDFSEPLKKIDNDTIKYLVTKGYLKSELSKPEPSLCEYHSLGDLSNGGLIYCRYHGDLEHLIESEYCKTIGEDYLKLPQDLTDQEFAKNKDKIIKIRDKYREKERFRVKFKEIEAIILVIIVIGSIAFIIIGTIIEVIKLIIKIIKRLKEDS